MVRATGESSRRQEGTPAHPIQLCSEADLVLVVPVKMLVDLAICPEVPCGLRRKSLTMDHPSWFASPLGSPSIRRFCSGH